MTKTISTEKLAFFHSRREMITPFDYSRPSCKECTALWQDAAEQ